MEYVREEKGNYVIMPRLSEQVGYREKMLLSGNIKTVLKASVRHMDAKSYYYYDIKSRQTLKALAEIKKFDSTIMTIILQSLTNMSSELSDFLLDSSEIIYLPECIYFDYNSDCLNFCFYPTNEEQKAVEIYGSIKGLAEFLIENTDCEDEKAVKLSYGLYEQISQGRLDIESLLITKVTDKDIIEDPLLDIDFVRENDQEAESYYFREIEEEENITDIKQLLPLFICTGVILAAGIVYVILFTNSTLLQQLGIRQKDYIVFGGILGLSLVLLLLFIIELLVKRRDRKGEDEETIQKDGIDNSDSLSMDYEKMEYMTDGDNHEDETVIIKPFMSNMETENQAYLVSIRDENIKIEIDESTFLIGKSKAKVNAVILAPGISRVHACIKRENGEFYVRDMNSTNGTFVNGKELRGDEKYLLSNGDRVRLGDMEFMFVS